jgi:hypothetical protein
LFDKHVYETKVTSRVGSPNLARLLEQPDDFIFHDLPANQAKALVDFVRTNRHGIFILKNGKNVSCEDFSTILLNDGDALVFAPSLVGG